MARTSKFTEAQKAHFVAVAKREGYTKAAKEAKVTGPTVYNWAKALNGHAKKTIKRIQVENVKILDQELRNNLLDSTVRAITREELAKALASLHVEASITSRI